MKYDYSSDYISKKPAEAFTVTYNFTDDLGTSDAITAATVTIEDINSVDKTASMISSIATPSPSVTFTISNGSTDTTYQITVLGKTTGSKKHIGNIVCEVVGLITLNSKLGDSDANSYVTLKEANDYIRNKYGHSDTWDTLSIEGRKRLLIQATEDIDRYNFVNEKYYDNQALAFPRDDHDIITGNCATPLTNSSFKNTGFTTDTYGETKSNTNYWKYGAIHITSATPLYDVRNISTSNVTTDVVSVSTDFTATPTTNTAFIAFEPLHYEIKTAQIEQALFIARTKGKSTFQTYSAVADRVKIGDVDVYFKQAGGSGARQPLSTVTRKLISRWVDRVLEIQRG